MIKNHSGMYRDVIFHRSKSKNQQEMTSLKMLANGKDPLY